MTETGSWHGSGVNHTTTKSPVMSYKSLLEWQIFFQGMVFQIITDGDDIKIVTSILMLLPL